MLNNKVMRKIIFIALISVFTQTALAQEVYKEVLRLSKNVMNDKKKDLSTRKIAMFKVDVLNYMAEKASEVMPDSSVLVLDEQAYALYDYINYYLHCLKNAKRQKERTHIMELFKMAAAHHPLVHDPDTKLVTSYYNDRFITQFSMDTNWIKAKEEVRTFFK